jgi:ABC-type nitrate/sulfonate/bicarbonate transport system substrate-binding protein
MKTNKKTAFSIIATAIVVLGAAYVLWPHAPKGYSGKTEAITIGAPLIELSALIYIAENQHFFTGNGLNVLVRDYDLGVHAFNSMLRGESDIGIAAEFPLVVKAFQKEKVRTIGSIGKFEFVYLVGRKDRGIEKISDLKGKRVGTAQGTIAEFYLGRYLHLHGMNLEGITFVDIQDSGQAVDAIVSGDIDASLFQEPYATSLVERLGANAVVWPVQSGQMMFSSIVCRDEWITHHPDLVTRVLNSLAQAEEYIVNHPVEVEAILRKRLNLTASYAKTVWLRNQFSLSLDQSLVAAMEDEARWMIKNGLTTEARLPDFTSYIYTDGLKSIKPEAVSIVR